MMNIILTTEVGEVLETVQPFLLKLLRGDTVQHFITKVVIGIILMFVSAWFIYEQARQVSKLLKQMTHHIHEQRMSLDTKYKLSDFRELDTKENYLKILAGLTGIFILFGLMFGGRFMSLVALAITYCPIYMLTKGKGLTVKQIDFCSSINLILSLIVGIGTILLIIGVVLTLFVLFALSSL